MVLSVTVTKAPRPADPLPARLLTGKEIATLEVRGGLYTNWTSVRVEQRNTEPFPVFQFEATEESPMPQLWDALQFIPGDIVRVYVGGVPAVFGYITERHVGFDGSNHGVRLIGCGDTVDITNSSVPPELFDGHDGKDWSTLARDLMMHLGIKLKEKGAVDHTVFENIAVLPGEKIYQTLARYANMRNIIIGSDANGGLLAIGEHAANPTGDLVEGVNILRANAVFHDQEVFRKYYTLGQANGTNSNYGDSQNKQMAYEVGSSTRNRILVTIADVADSQHGIQRRALMEKVFSEGAYLDAQITVQGWFKNQNKSDDVWKAGEYYVVNSPSLILNDFVLGCKGCVYEQSDQGTTTTLTMCRPIHMNGQWSGSEAARRVVEIMRKRAEEAAAAAAAAAANPPSQN